MAASTLDKPDRPGWRTWLGMVALGLLGWVLAAVAGIVAAFVTMYASTRTEVMVFSALIGVPAVLLWWKGTRYGRSLSAGLLSAWLFSLWLLLAWHPWSTMSAEEQARAAAEIRDAGHPPYYLGPRLGEFAWNDYDLDGSYTELDYGSCHPRPDDGDYGCTTWDITVTNEPTLTYLAYDAMESCQRPNSDLDVPTVKFETDPPTVTLEDGRPTTHDRSPRYLGVFTGTTMVLITFGDDHMSLDQKISVAERLRPVGVAHSATLSPPSADAVAYVDRYCGTGPP